MLKLFSTKNIGSDRDALARQIASRCTADVLRLMPAIAYGMNDAERRGYVRARAVGVVSRYVERYLCETPDASSDRRQLIDTALERVVHAVVGELQTQPVVAVPLPHIQPLKAA